MNNTAFDDWYDGMVGFHINSERIIDDINQDLSQVVVDPVKLRKWMVVCWNNAVEACENEAYRDFSQLKKNT